MESPKFILDKQFAMFAAKVLRIVFIHGRCFRTCYVLKLLTTMNAGTRTHEKRARTRPSVRKNTCGAELLCNS